MRPFQKFHHDKPITARMPQVNIPGFTFGTPPKQIRRSEDRLEVTSAAEITPAVRWIEENCIDPTSVNPITWDFRTARLIRLEPYQRRILNKVLTPDPKTGIFPYRTIVWSQIKKSGKTTTAGCVGAWYASQIEAPNVVLTVANNQEQGAGRIFAAMKPTFKRLGVNVPVAPNAKPEVRLANGTLVKAITTNYAGEAGENYGLTLWSELWAYVSEDRRRLFDELMPVPTRKNSLRWIETYAGFEDESDLLLSLYLKIFTDTTERETQPAARPVEGLEDITTGDGEARRPACYEVPEAGLFVFWDRERRMKWQTSEAGRVYFDQQKHDLRASAYIRLCENRWQKSTGDFIPDEWWRRSIIHRIPLRRMVLAIDASQRHDTTSLVGVFEEAGIYTTCFVEVHDPKGKDIDLEVTVQATVERLFRRGLIERLFLDDGEEELQVWYDPFQLHQIALNLQKKNIMVNEFQQGKERTKADSFLWRQYRDAKIRNPAHPDLETHVTSAKARELENEQFRIVKGTATDAKLVDACVAQSMAVYKASLLRLKRKKLAGAGVGVVHGTTKGWLPPGI